MYSLDDQSPGPLLGASAPGAGVPASLTYEPFFGLREKPFSLSADPRFLYRSLTHAPAFDDILAGIRRREGLIVLTGEIGTGKTTLCRSVIQQLDRRTFAAFVADPFVSREDLLKTLLVDFGVISISDLTRGRFNGSSRSDLSYPLYEFLDSLVPLQAFAVLVIDEAQNLSLPLLEEIRILSELERREKLLQVVLVGQPELRSSLRLPQMRQVDQRVSVRCELSALDAAGVAGYVNHRLNVAGPGNSRAEFTQAGLTAIHAGSSGVPRLINRICDRALQRAHTSRSMRIDAHIVCDAIDDLGLRSTAGSQDPGFPEESSNAADRHALAESPAPRSPSSQSAAIVAPAEEVVPGLLEFATEADPSVLRPAPIETSSGRQRWLMRAIASLLAIIASVGGATWYARAQAADDRVVTAPPLPPPAPPRLWSPPQITRLDTDAALLATEQPDASAAASADAPASAAAPAAVGYTIVVASFENQARADRLVEELTDAGYRARVVERLGGPARTRLLQVRIEGYASALEVERDLQQIRSLPGGYSDAQIVDRD